MGATTSAPIKQQVKALKGRRYKRGMRPDKYFDIVVKRELGELLEILTFSDDEAFELFVQVQTCRTTLGILLLLGRGIAGSDWDLFHEHRFVAPVIGRS